MVSGALPAPGSVVPTADTATSSRATVENLPALTSLRFFAAASIVLLHSYLLGFPGVSPSRFAHFELRQGVTFFFVLSGFIMAHVYPVLEGRGAWRFFVARAARIWPMHVFALLLWLIALPPGYRDALGPTSVPIVVANLFLVQAWVPAIHVFGSLNTVSWTLGAELFFYATFPFLVHEWRRTWGGKLGLTIVLAGGCIFAANHLLQFLPAAFSADGFTYSFPPARLAEFTIGIGTAYLWRRFRHRIELSRLGALQLELGALALVLFVMYYSADWGERLGRLDMIGIGGNLWLTWATFNALPCALLIFVMALGQGLLSQFFAARPLVLFGEISYSIYLLHYVFLHFYRSHPYHFVFLPDRLLYFVYWAVLLLASYLTWSLIEVPCRRAILTLWDGRYGASGNPERATARAQRRSGRFTLASIHTSRSTIVVGALLLMLVTALVVARQPVAQTAAIHAAPVQSQTWIDRIGSAAVTPGRPIAVDRTDCRDGGIAIVGWSIDPEQHGLVQSVRFILDDQAIDAVGYGLDRADVAAALRDDRFTHSGFAGLIPCQLLTEGSHALGVRVMRQGASEYVEAANATILVQ